MPPKYLKPSTAAGKGGLVPHWAQELAMTLQNTWRLKMSRLMACAWEGHPVFERQP